MIREKKSGIYQIKNLVNKKLYIGSAIYLNRRWLDHRKLLRLNKHPNIHIQSSWNKHKELSFEFSVLEYCEPSKLIEREQFWLDWSKPQYNLNPKAGSRLGTKHSKETIEKYKKRDMKSLYEKSAAKRKGIPLSKEQIEKIRASNKGQKRSEKYKKNLKERWDKRRGFDLPVILIERF